MYVGVCKCRVLVLYADRRQINCRDISVTLTRWYT